MAGLRRAASRVGVAVVSTSLTLIAGEGLCRWLDGTPVFARQIIAPRPPPSSAEPPDLAALARSYAARVPRAAGVSFDFYGQEPAPLPRSPMPAWARARLARYPSEGSRALFQFNRAFLQDRLCQGLDAGQFGQLDDFLFFEPSSSAIYPSYRLTPNLTTPGGLTTNAHGWRGPEITADRAADTIRIAFVGASTTVNDEGYAFSYPELIGRWLTLWGAARRLPYRFEIANAARTGINSHSIAAIVADEVVPVDPDLVVYYEGSNQFWPSDYLGYRFGRLYPRPQTSSAWTRRVAARSALAARAVRFVEVWQGGDGREPVKPIQWLRLGDVDEQHPDPDDPQLPVQLPAIVQDLDRVRHSLAPAKAELVLSSFVWMAQDGLRLELPRQINLFSYLNGFWPASYRNIRRLADLQNRVFARYAQQRGVPFIDVAGAFPLDSNLFGDAIHLRYPGVRLHAWIVLQQLVEILEARLNAGMLPRPARLSSSGAQTTILDGPPPLVTRATILSSCPRAAR